MKLSIAVPLGKSWRELKYLFVPPTRGQKILYLVLLFALTLAVIVPLSAIFIFSFAETFPLREGYQFTIVHYTEFFALQQDLLIDLTVNTFYYAFGATVLGMVIGILVAIFVVKYLGQSTIQIFMLIPYGIPAVASLTGWVLLLGKAGVLTVFVMDLFDLSSPPWDIYSIYGMVFVEGLHLAPVAFLLTLPALRNIPQSLDEASFISGADRMRTFRKIILPVIWPSIFSTFIFLFVRTLATVATPSVLGVPDQTFTYGSAIPYLFLAGGDLNYSKALSFSVLITAVTAIFIIYYLRILEQEGKFTTVIGTGRSEPKLYDTSRAKRSLGIGAIGVYLIVAGALPMIAVLWASILPRSQLHLVIDFSQFTTANYEALFAGRAVGVFGWWRAVRNTVAIGLVVPTTSMVICFLISYANQTVKMPLRRTLSFLASIPLAIPGIARSMGFLAGFIQSPIYGTFWVLFIAYHGFAIPIGMRYASPALTRIGVENTEASILSGDGIIRSFRKITIPLVKEDFIAGWMHLFVGSIRNISIPILLYTAGSEVIAVQLLNVLQAGAPKAAATIAAVLTIMSIVPYTVLQWWRISLRRRRATVTMGG